MKKISKIVIEEYKYDSKEEREEHVKEMKSAGYYCTGQSKNMMIAYIINLKESITGMKSL